MSVMQNDAIQVALALIVMLVLATLTIASAISGQLTLAAVSSAGLLTLVVLVFVMKRT